MQRTHLMASSAIAMLHRPLMLGLGQPTFAPEMGIGEAPGSDSGAGGNNGAGNAGTGGIDSSGENNAGDKFDPEAFWKEPEPDPALKKGEGTGAGEDSEGAKTGKALMEEMRGIQFKPVFDDSVIAELAEGKTDGINKAIGAQLQAGVQHAVVMAAKLMAANNAAQTARFQALVDEKFGNRDNTDSLLTNFPSAKDPALRPVIQGVFDQALKLSKGDRPAAIKATKSMLGYMGKTAAGDLGIPPNNSADDFGGESSASFIQELLSK